MKKKVNVFGKTIPVFVIALLGIAVVSAALIGYWGTITGQVTVNQGLFLDGRNYEAQITEDAVTMYSLEEKTVSSGHYLENTADIPAVVTLGLGENDGCFYNQNFNGGSCDKITTTYLTFEGATETVEEGRENSGGAVVYLDDTTDAYSTLGNINLKIDYENSQAVFTITTPEGMIDSTPETYTGSVAFIVDEDADDTTDWQVLYEPGSLYEGHETDWGYEEGYDESGNAPSPRAFVDATDVSDIEVVRDGDNFIVKVDLDRLGGIGSEYKVGFYISHLTEHWFDNNLDPTGAGQVMIYYPKFDQFDWADTGNYETRTIGTELESPFEVTVPAHTKLDFAIANYFPQMTYPGTYTITTTVK